MIWRALVLTALSLILALAGWPAVLGILAAAGLWHAFYRIQYGRWPPLD